MVKYQLVTQQVFFVKLSCIVHTYMYMCMQNVMYLYSPSYIVHTYIHVLVYILPQSFYAVLCNHELLPLGHDIRSTISGPIAY